MMHGIRPLGIREEAERSGFIALFPNGTARHPWAAAGTTPDGPLLATSSRRDDVRFIAQLLDLVESKYPIDPDRVYATGISNGAAMSYRLAC